MRTLGAKQRKNEENIGERGRKRRKTYMCLEFVD
jgi:hypothetical protein